MGYQAPAKAMRRQLLEHVVGEASVLQGVSAVFALVLARLMKLSGEKSRVEAAASMAGRCVEWVILLCWSHSVGAETEGKSCSGNSVNAMKKSGQKPATEVAGKT